ncbi:MAG: ABC transporter ATP-binding protein [candidate division WOR-3 bacterium]
MELAVEIKDLKRNYGSLQALKGVSFNINENEIFGLIGPNASGKTTTLRIVATLLKPTSGLVHVFGHDVAKRPEEVRRLISYLPEEAGLYKNLTGIDYLKFMATFYSTDDHQRDEIVNLGIEIAGIKERLNDKVKTYSKGMARKLLLARALMVRPRLAILDEPTSGLDVANSLEIRERIKDFARQGTTVLLSSHNMLEIELLSERVALIKDGIIKETGTPEELKQKYSARNLEEVFIKIE